MESHVRLDPEGGWFKRALSPAPEPEPAGVPLEPPLVDYRTLVEQLPCITYTQVPDPVSPTGYRDVFISPQCEAILGYTPEEWQVDPTLWATVTHPEDRGAVIEEDERASETGDVFRSEYRMVARDGSVVWFRDEAVRVKDPVTGGEMWQGVMTDVTQEKLAQEHLRETETRYKSLVETLPAVVFVDRLDKEGSNLYTSPRSTEMLGYAPEDWRNNPGLWRELIHPDDRERVLEANTAHNAARGLFDQEYRMIAKDGRTVWVRDMAVVLGGKNGEPLYSQGFFLDVTAQKAIETALKAALAREHDTSERLRRLDEMKNTVLRTLSHDVRNPLTSVLGFASTLQREGLRLSRDEHHELITAIETNARRILKLLTDILDQERLEKGVIELQRAPTELGDLVRSLVVTLAGTLGERAVHVRTEPVTIEVDAGKVERIVENLLLNAVSHTPDTSQIWLRVEPVNSPARGDVGGDRGALIIVDDDGPGVSDDLKQAIFEPFRRAPNAGPSGTGVGLSLVARFAILHGGRAWVEDRPGGGASFRVFLPSGGAAEAI